MDATVHAAASINRVTGERGFITVSTAVTMPTMSSPHMVATDSPLEVKSTASPPSIRRSARSACSAAASSESVGDSRRTTPRRNSPVAAPSTRVRAWLLCTDVPLRSDKGTSTVCCAERSRVASSSAASTRASETSDASAVMERSLGSSRTLSLGIKSSALESSLDQVVRISPGTSGDEWLAQTASHTPSRPGVVVTEMLRDHDSERTATSPSAAWSLASAVSPDGRLPAWAPVEPSSSPSAEPLLVLPPAGLPSRASSSSSVFALRLLREARIRCLLLAV
mmetsp:Transcript_6610/g.19975  ORF Transcript_6610/g.19975 Transcript_6610/m.19975 type:complete len:281 (+) Transcript_6610:856-1698(+)